MSDSYRATDDYSKFSAAELRQAAQSVAADLAQDTTNHSGYSQAYIQQEQDLQTYLLREAERR